MAHALYLVAYDVSSPDRLRHTLSAIKPHRASGQKSVAECFLQPAERDHLCTHLVHTINLDTDRLLVLRLDPRMTVRLYGIATQYRGEVFIVS